MKPVIQQEKAGCAIASAAAIAGISYAKAKRIANGLGITARDSTLWSSTKPVRSLLKNLGIKTGAAETAFKNWQSLPDCALLAIKWHKQKGKAYWHWVVYVREENKEYVLDSKKLLKTNIRTDFGRIKPKWYIEVDS
jgi:ABC-type bacteriocin/lantibiotic exporter with double-glycine peptidase domain